MATIAFLGLGNMGAPMAANLAKAGHRVVGFDPAPNAAANAEKAGIALASDPTGAVDGADVVITMLPAGGHVLASWRGILPVAPKTALFIDASTIDVGSARAAHDMARSAALDSLDAPVSGGVGGAEAGTLTFMVGGDEPAFERAKPFLQAMGKRIVHCGGPGAGQAAKICNNMILGATMIATCEAFALGEKLGLTHQALFDVAANASGQSWSLTSYCPVPGPVPASPANRDYRPGFAAALMLKDLKLSQQAAAEVGATTPLGALAAQLYGLFVAEGHAGEDFSAIMRFLRGERDYVRS
jgi:3-hydroxyisobutyrate dehydrogenase